MAYTQLQKLRKMRARNKGLNRILGSTLRRVAAQFEKKGPEELTRQEVNTLQTLRSMLATRLRISETGKLNLLQVVELETRGVICSRDCMEGERK